MSCSTPGQEQWEDLFPPTAHTFCNNIAHEDGRVLTKSCIFNFLSCASARVLHSCFIVVGSTSPPFCQGAQKKTTNMHMPGVEPGSQAWEACMMPLHYMRLFGGGKPRNNASIYLGDFQSSWPPPFDTINNKSQLRFVSACCKGKSGHWAT